MADDVRVTNWPQTASAEEVAYKLWNILRTPAEGPEQQLEFYAKCLDATRTGGQTWGRVFNR